jgi:hypothetical protein
MLLSLGKFQCSMTVFPTWYLYLQASSDSLSTTDGLLLSGPADRSDLESLGLFHDCLSDWMGLVSDHSRNQGAVCSVVLSRELSLNPLNRGKHHSMPADPVALSFLLLALSGLSAVNDFCSGCPKDSMIIALASRACLSTDT